MILTHETFTRMIRNIRAIYGSSWRPDVDKDHDRDAYIQFFQNCQEIIPDEMADVLITVYRTRREAGPRSPYDIVKTYIEKQLEEAKTSEFVIEKLTAAIRDYEYSDEELPFENRDEYLFANVIPMFPCPSGIKEFYVRNKKKLERLALRSPDDYDESKIYADLGKDYDKQLIIAERKSIIKQVARVALPNGNNINQLEA